MPLTPLVCEWAKFDYAIAILKDNSSGSRYCPRHFRDAGCNRVLIPSPNLQMYVCYPIRAWLVHYPEA